MNELRENRGRLDIAASILTATQKDALKDSIRQKCNMSSKQFNEYIKILLENGLIDAFPAVNLKHTCGPKNKRRTIFHIAQTGKRFLKLYSELYALVDRHVANSFLGNSPSPRQKGFATFLHRQGR